MTTYTLTEAQAVKLAETLRYDFIAKMGREPVTGPFSDDYRIDIKGNGVFGVVAFGSYVLPTADELSNLMSQDKTLQKLQDRCVEDFLNTPPSLTLTVYVIMKKMNEIIAMINGGAPAQPWADVSTLTAAIASLDTPVKEALSDPAVRAKLRIQL